MTTQELNDYAMTRKTTLASVDACLDDCGIGHDVQNRLHDAFKLIGDFCADLQAKACGQVTYDALTNIPLGILHHSDPLGQHALKSAIVSAIGALVHWDIIGALEMAADIAEDVNAHPEAAKIREMAARAGVINSNGEVA